MAEPLMQFDAVLRREHFNEFSGAFQKKFAHVAGGLLNGLAWIVPLLALMLAFAEWASRAGMPRDPNATFGPLEISMLAVLGGILMTLLLSWFFARRQMKAYKDGTLRDGGSYLGERRFTLDSDGITSQGAHGQALTRWSAMIEMSEAPNTYLLWTDPGAAVMVPKDGFENAEERQRFEAIVAAQLHMGCGRD